MKDSDAVSHDLAILYELALNVHTSDDIKLNSTHFLGLLLERLQYRRAALYRADQEKDSHYQCIISSPFHKSFPEKLNAHFNDFGAEENFKVKNPSETNKAIGHNEAKYPWVLYKMTGSYMVVYEVNHRLNLKDVLAEANKLKDVFKAFDRANQDIIKDQLLAATRSKLEESEKRWKYALAGNQDGVWDWEVPSGKVFFSERWKSMLGYQKNEIGNGLEEWTDRVHPDDLDDAMQQVKKHLDGKTQTYYHEHRLQCKDGSYLWIADRGKVIEKDKHGKALRFVGTHTDISWRKKLELENQQYRRNLEQKVKQRTAELEKTTKRYKQIFENIQDVFIETTPDGIITTVSPSVEKFHYKPEELIGKSTLTFYENPAERERFRKHFEENQGSDQFVIKGKDGKGQTRYISVNSSVANTSDGQRFVGSLRDITDFMISRKKLEESEKRFRDYIDSAPVGAHILDENGNILYWNKVFQKTFNVPGTIKHLHFKDFNYDSQLKEAAGKFQMMKTHGKADFVQEVKTYDNQPLTIRMVASPLSGGGFIGFAEDITQKNEQELSDKIELNLVKQLKTYDSSQHLLNEFLTSIMELPGVDAGGIYLIENDALVLKSHHNLSKRFIQQTSSYSLEDEHAQLVLKGEPVISGGDQVKELVCDLISDEITALGSFPFRIGSHIAGTINVASKSRKNLPPPAVNTLIKMSVRLGEIINVFSKEKELRESYRDFEALFDSIGSFMFILDQQGRIIHVNRTVTERLGYTKDELLSKPVLFVHPEDRHQEALTIVNDMIKGSQDACYVPLKTASGKAIPVETKVIPGKWRGQKALIGMSWDITAIEEANKAVKESQEALQELNKQLEKRVEKRTQELLKKENELNEVINNTQIGFYRNTLDGQVLLANPALVKMLGFDNEEELKAINVGDHYIDYIANKRFDTLMEKQGYIENHETRWRKKDGTIIYLLENSRKIKDDEGNYFFEGSIIDVTEKKKLEDELLRTEATYSKIVENAPIGILYANKEGDIRFINKHFLNLMGSPGFAETKKINLLHNPHMVEQGFSEMVKEALKQPETPLVRDLDYESIWNVKRHLSVTIQPLPMSKEYGFVVLALDKTEEYKHARQKDLHLKMEESILRTSALLAQTSFERLTSDIEGAMGEIGQYINADRVYVFEYEDEYQKMSNTYEWAAPGISEEKENLKDFPAAMFPWWNNRIYNHKTVQVPDVESMPAEASAEQEILKMQDIKSLVVLPLSYQGKPMGFIGFDSVKRKRNFDDFDQMVLQMLGDLIINTKIREAAQYQLSNQNQLLDQKVKERTAELQKTNTKLTNEIEQRKELEKEGKLLWQALENSSNGVIITNDQFVIEYVNKAIERETGLKTEKIIGQNTDIFLPQGITPENIKRIATELKKAKPFRDTIRTIGKHGREKIYTLLVSPVFKTKKIVNKYVMIVNDITYRKKLEQELQLNEKMAAVGTLAGSIAHEFNNILQVISVYRELIDLHFKNEKINPFIKEIINATDKGKVLVDSLLNYSRTSNKEMKAIRVDKTVNNSLALIKPLVKSYIKFSYDIVDTGEVMGFQDKIEQVVINLFTNAQKAVRTKGRGEVTLRTNYTTKAKSNTGQKEGQWAQIIVEDNGIGISAGEQEKIFDLFYTTNDVGEGTGIGLASVKKIVEQHQGFIFIESSEGEGTVFYVNLPVIKSKE